MKKLIAVLIIGICSVALAVVSITISVPDVHVPRVIAMMEAWKDSHISFHVQGSQNASDPNVPDYSADWDFRINSMEGETTAQYADRFVKTWIREMVKAHEYKIDKERYEAEISDVNVPDVNVPDEVIQ